MDEIVISEASKVVDQEPEVSNEQIISESFSVTDPLEPILTSSDVPIEETKPVEPKESKPLENASIRIKTKATVEWKTGPEGSVISTEEVYRSLDSIYQHFSEVLKEHPEKINDYLEVYLQVILDDASKVAPQMHLAKGPLQDVIIKLKSIVTLGEDVVKNIYMYLNQITETSNFKGAMLTVVIGDAVVNGFTYLSDASEVTDTDIKVLGASAAHQAEMFKDKMREVKNITFPGDKNNIIVSSSLPPNLKFSK